MSDSQTNSQTAPAPQLQVKFQYLKDLSFEHPQGCEALVNLGQVQPKFNVNIDVKVNKLPPENHFDVHLILNAQATANDAVLFIAEVTYAGVFALQNMNPEQSQYVTLVECARLLFPFARSYLAQMTREAGFPPMMLDMVDFHAMFVQKMQPQGQPAAA